MHTHRKLRARRSLTQFIEGLEPRKLLSAALVKDINPGPASSDPQYIAELNGLLYFEANDGVHGNELWKTDGTEAGTSLVKDIYPGPDSGIPTIYDNYSLAVNNKLFFSATDPTYGRGPWVTDGTEAGTVMLVDTSNGTGAFANVGNTVYFTADYTLFKSDGTPAGTVPVAALPAEGTSTFASVNGILIFTTRTGSQTSPQTLWRSDGTAAGTFPLVTPADGGPAIPPSPGVACAYIALNGRLWRTDGSAAGTSVALDENVFTPRRFGDTLYWAEGDNELWRFRDGEDTSRVLLAKVREQLSDAYPPFGPFAYANGVVLFTAGSGVFAALWRSGGSPENTASVVPLTLSNADYAMGYNSPMVNANGTVYFVAGANTAQLWKTDGTAAGTVVAEQFPSPLGTNGPIFAGGKIYVTVRDATLGTELWVYDDPSLSPPLAAFANGPYPSAPENGALRLNGGANLDPDPGNTPGFTYEWDLDNDGLFGETGAAASRGDETGPRPFFSAAGVDSSATFPITLRVTAPGGAQATSSTTVTVKNIAPSPSITGAPTIAPIGTPLTFGSVVTDPSSADQAAGFTYAWTATRNGTPYSFPVGTIINAPILSFVPDRTGTFELTLTATDKDGGAGTTVQTFNAYTPGVPQYGASLVQDIFPGPASSVNPDVAPVTVNGIVYFVANDGVAGDELWRSDGTPAGTYLLKDFTPGDASTTFVALYPFGSQLIVLTATPTAFEVWSSDGTLAGTTRVAAETAGRLAAARLRPITVGPSLYFFVEQRPGSSSSIGLHVWRTDGTTAGTARVTSFNSTGVVRYNSDPAELGGALYLTRNSTLHRINLTTGQITTVAQPGGTLGDLTRLGSNLFFAEHTSSSRTLWKTDGTTTVAVKDIGPKGPGATSQDSPNWVAFNGALYFVGNDPTNGRALWRSDGTAAGTGIVLDIVPNSTFLDVQQFSVLNGSLVFSESLTGLWRTDGTPAGTVRFSTRSASDGVLLVAGSSAYFRSSDSSAGNELWRTDGTHTFRIANVAPGDLSSSPTLLGAAGSKILFSATDWTTGRELWVHDPAAWPESVPPFVQDLSGGASFRLLGPPGNQVLLVASGSVSLTSLAWDTHPGLALSITDGATVSLAGPQRFSSVSVAAGGVLNLNDQPLLVDYTGPTPTAALRQLLSTGRITSSGAPANHSIGYGEAAHLSLTTFSNQFVDPTAVLLKLALTGDANLDGTLNADDSALLDRGRALSKTTWTFGDFNHDGVINQADTLLLNQTRASLMPPPAPLPLPLSTLSTTPTAPTMLPPSTPATTTTKTPVKALPPKINPALNQTKKKKVAKPHEKPKKAKLPPPSKRPHAPAKTRNVLRQPTTFRKP